MKVRFVFLFVLVACLALVLTCPDWLIVTGSSLLIGLPPHLGKSWRFASYLGVSWLAVVGSIGPM